ncbi:MAG: thiamine/thiamine pyrophosphate ABC transporter permease [Alphaproteobacteria bacterium]
MSLRPALLPGALTLGALALVVGGALAALLAAAPPGVATGIRDDAYLGRVVAFTFWQAGLSALLAVGLAVPVARALARRSAFPGREALLRLFGLPLVIPVIVAVLGVVAVYGQNGLVNRALAAAGVATGPYLYGLAGILIAHVFFNMPLATRFLLYAWQAVPGESWRLASQFGMSSAQIFRLIEWPVLRQAIPGVAGLVFLLCFTSFAVVLTLGGGPAATIIEVAIYQALRLDFDLARAVTLALLQLALCAAFVAFGQRFAQPAPSAPTERRAVDRPDLDALAGRIADAAVILAATLYVALPLAAVLYRGLTGPVTRVLGDPTLWQAAARSLSVALSAGLIALVLGWCLLMTSRELRLRMYRKRLAEAVEWGGSLVLVVSPIVLGAGLFVLLLPLADVFEVGLGLVVAVNAVMGLPYVVRLLGPPLMRLAEHHDRLCASLGVAGWNRLRLIDWPALRRPAALAFAVAATLAMGDLGAIALFGTRETATLPLLLYRRMGSYRLDEAAVTALFLVMLCLLLFFVVERGMGGRGER